MNIKIELIRIYKKYIISRMLHRWAGPTVLLLMLHFNPKSIGEFVKFVLVVLRNRISLPLTQERLTKSDSILDDFDVEISNPNDYPGLEYADEINIVMRGNSLSLYWDQIDHSLPTYYINVYSDFFEEYFTDNLPDNAIYITSDKSVYNAMLKSGLSPVYRVYASNDQINMDKSDDGTIRLITAHKSGRCVAGGSGHLCTVLLCSLSNKINIYGWDAYFSKQVSDMSYYECMRDIFLRARHGGPLMKENGKLFTKIKGLYYTNRLLYMMTKISSIHLAARLLKLKDKNVSIMSFMSGALNQSTILGKLDKIFYKN